ncbi:MAG: TonB family protein [Flavobacteriaceae bacterium]|jgi:TonB family protein
MEDSIYGEINENIRMAIGYYANVKPSKLDYDGYSFEGFVGKNCRYPEKELDNNIQGVVTILFVVETDGKVSHLIIEKSPSDNFSIEVRRLFRGIPKWIPKKNDESTIQSKVRPPIRFNMHTID